LNVREEAQKAHKLSVKAKKRESEKAETEEGL